VSRIVSLGNAIIRVLAFLTESSIFENILMFSGNIILGR